MVGIVQSAGEFSLLSEACAWLLQRNEQDFQFLESHFIK